LFACRSAGERQALREQVEAALFVEGINNGSSGSPFCLFSNASGGCAR
jgi:hypothetical protein